MISFNIIVAVDSKFGIGKSGRLPWNLPQDMKHFKSITTKVHATGKQNAVVMGRKTWESLPAKFRPLPTRLNVVISRQSDLSLPDGVIKTKNFLEALDILKGMGKKIGGVFVIGGAQVFAEALQHPDCQRIYLTKIEKQFACDTFFPEDLSQFREVNRSTTSTENDLPFYFCEYERLNR